ncbi:MAG: transposase, partial [Actinobacteria bacterium]|nr:transposase [Actinomycetota bacterium]
KLVVIPRFEATSKPCSKCGWVRGDLTLSDRTFHCEACGHTADRDDNAADNILSLAVSSTERVNGRGEDVRPAGLSRQTLMKRQSEEVA